jgi:hypothetical protein
MFVGGLAIGGECFEVGPKRVPDTASHGACRDFGWSGFALAQRLLERGDCDIGPNGTAVAKSVGDRFRHAEDRDRDAFDVVGLDPVMEKLISEADDAQRRVVDLGLPFFRTDRDPDPTWHLVGDTVESQGRDEANDPLGHALGGFGKTMVAVRSGVGELIEPAAEPSDKALPFQPGNGGRRDAGPTDFGQAGDAVLAQEGCELFPLRAWLG